MIVYEKTCYIDFLFNRQFSTLQGAFCYIEYVPFARSFALRGDSIPQFQGFGPLFLLFETASFIEPSLNRPANEMLHFADICFFVASCLRSRGVVVCYCDYRKGENSNMFGLFMLHSS